LPLQRIFRNMWVYRVGSRLVSSVKKMATPVTSALGLAAGDFSISRKYCLLSKNNVKKEVMESFINIIRDILKIYQKGC